MSFIRAIGGLKKQQTPIYENLWDTNADAASPNNEVNSIADGWYNGGSAYTLTSVAASGGATGSYMVSVSAGTTTTGSWNIEPPYASTPYGPGDFNIPGIYQVTLDLAFNSSTATAGQFYAANGYEWVQGTGSVYPFYDYNTTGVWQTATITVEYTGYLDAASGRLQFYLENFGGSDTLYIDNVRWYKLT